MTLLTNIWWQVLAGTTQYLIDFIQYNEKSADFCIYGIDIIHPLESRSEFPQNIFFRKFKLIKEVFYYPNLHNLGRGKKLNISVLRENYRDTINLYIKIIDNIKPDIILINGDGLLSWCLLQAARHYKQAKIFVHYHGILSREITHWSKRDKFCASLMEKDFKDKDICYIFPSFLAKNIIETEIFGKKILENKNIVIPNPIPDEFLKCSFEKNLNKRKAREIGIIGRWQKIKNCIKFIIALSKRNNSLNDPFQISIITEKSSSEIIEKYPQVGRIYFRKPMDRKNLADFYTNQGIIICCSDFETYGNVAQESIVLRTPAIVNLNMGVSETFKKVGLDSLIINFNYTKDLLTQIETLIANPIPNEAVNKLKNLSGNNIFPKYLSFIMTRN